MLSQYGLWLDEMDDLQAATLTVSYLRRLKFEQKALSVSILSMVGGALGGNKQVRVPSSVMLGMLEGKL